MRTTLLHARVDADSNVLSVEIVQSSGSANVDADRKLSVYDWTLEPAKDKQGRPVDFDWLVMLQ